MIGTILGGYEIHEEIGKGGMAVVYKAFDPRTRRDVAIKILDENLANDSVASKRFVREVEVIAKLEHPHILPIYWSNEDNGLLYMVMRYVSSGTLADRIAMGAMPFAEIFPIFDNLAEALDYTHQQQIIHRDIKPNNILIDEHGAYLADFGIVNIITATTSLTNPGFIVGSLPYMSPEQLQGDVPLKPASDQYALALVVYEMVTGTRIYQGKSAQIIAYEKMNGILPPTPSTFRADLPDAAEQVLLKALAPNPDDRYMSNKDFARAFRKAWENPSDTNPAPVSHSWRSITYTPSDAVMDVSTAMALPADAKLKRKPVHALASRVQVMAILLLIFVMLLIAVLIGTVFKQQIQEMIGTVAVSPIVTVTATLLPSATVTPEPQPSQSITGSRVDISLSEPMQLYRCASLQKGNGICVVSFLTGEVHQILADFEMEIDPVMGWSPDGQQLVFTAPWASLASSVYRINVDGTGLTKIVDEAYNPTWSPDGEWIAFAYRGGRIAIIHPGGTDLRLIWSGAPTRNGANPQWSPDSQSLVFVVGMAHIPDSPFSVRRDYFVVPIADRVATTVASATGDCANILDTAFSPDSQSVVYYDTACIPHQIAADGTGEPMQLEYFPISWTSYVYPQWQD